ncbi:MAG: APC family permease [Anaerolineae bacterium]|nr:APC family permease [Anaerolineae bacterium]
MLHGLRRVLIGSPLPTKRMAHERLGKAQALAVLSSDALSSVAYATEEILLVLVLGGSAAVSLTWPVALAIAGLLILVVASYYQTVHAYPSGGGAYIVTRENLGTMPSLVAAAALLTDYVLTVAVSISAGVAAVTSAFPSLFSLRIELALVLIAFITLVNLRGVRESGRVFAVPTYFFMTMLFSLVGVGLWRIAVLGEPGRAATTWATLPPTPQAFSVFLILRAFSSGCTALTGIEAIADGVPIFKKPEAENAAKTLLWMGGILVTMFLGITYLAGHYGILPHEGETVVSQLGRQILGSSPAYYLLQAATASILILAANTSFADFPRLAMWVAKDRYLPHQLTNVGDRLVYANGIVALGVLASLLVVVFGASTHRLIPLYAVGVFTAFTLSQLGMVRRWSRLRTPGWWRSAAFNAVGGMATAVVLVVVAATKFVHGAWIVLLLIPALIFMFLTIHRHYQSVAAELSLGRPWPDPVECHTVIVPIAGLHQGVVKALRYAQVLGGDLHVVTVEVDPEETSDLLERCQKYMPDLTVEVLPSPYRSVVEPLAEYIERFVDDRDHYVTVVIPQFVPRRWWHYFLHNQTAIALQWRLLFSHRGWRSRFRVITEVPFYLER